MQRRRLHIVLAAITSTTLATGGLILASPAASAADATTTAVTSISGTQFRQYDDQTGSPAMEVKGTSNGDASAKFDLRCYYSTGSADWNVLVDNAAFAADGSFDVLYPTYKIEESTCVIRAIPRTGGASQSPTDMGSFHGLSASGGEVTTYDAYQKSSSDLAGGQLYGYYIESSQAGGDMGWDSVGECGLDFAYLYDSTGTPAGNPSIGGNTFSCAGQLPVDVGVGTAQHRSAIQVDGVNAVDPYEAEDELDGTRAPGLTVTVVHDGATGNQVITESEPVVACAITVYPLSPDHCATYTSTGVRLDRVVIEGGGGRVASVRDTFTSTDGQAHDVSLVYENRMQLPNAGQQLRIPWSASGTSYAAHTTGDAIGAAPAGPGSIDWIANAAAAASLLNPVASLTYSAAPSAVLFGDLNDYYLTYGRHVPAGGTNGLTQTFSQGASQAEVDGYKAAAVTAYKSGLKVALTGVPATSATKVLAVHGTFSGGANGLPSTATVGVGTTQQSVPVANDGTFTANVTLVPGANSIAVAGTDDAGLQGATSAAVAYTNPVTAGTPKVTKKTKTVTKRVKKGQKTVTVKVKKVTSEAVSDTVTCAAFATASCTGALTIFGGTATGGRKLFSIAPGKSAVVVVPVSPTFIAKINALKSGKHLAATAVAAYIDPTGGSLTTAPKAFRLA